MGRIENTIPSYLISKFNPLPPDIKEKFLLPEELPPQVSLSGIEYIDKKKMKEQAEYEKYRDCLEPIDAALHIEFQGNSYSINPRKGNVFEIDYLKTKDESFIKERQEKARGESICKTTDGIVILPGAWRDDLDSYVDRVSATQKRKPATGKSIGGYLLARVQSTIAFIRKAHTPSKQLNNSQSSQQSSEPIIPNQVIFYIQIGAFQDRNGAEVMIDRVKDETGYSAEIFEAYVDDKYYHRVRIGGFANRKEAQTILDTIKEKGIDGYITQR